MLLKNKTDNHIKIFLQLFCCSCFFTFAASAVSGLRQADINNSGGRRKTAQDFWEGKAIAHNEGLKTIVGNDNTKPPPEYIFGFSTGHAGSTSLHTFLVNLKGCPWGKASSGFEKQVDSEKDMYTVRSSHDDSDLDYVASCNFTRDKVIPGIDEWRKRGKDNTMTTWIDIGHYHNRGPVLECLAELLGDRAAFVRIRRSRHDIAFSFANMAAGLKGSPCLFGELADSHPRNSYCPLSKDVASSARPVALPIQNDTVWLHSSTNRFQKFLWMADDLEMRWYNLRHATTLHPSGPQPRYYEVTWNTGAEYDNEVCKLTIDLGCKNVECSQKVPNKEQHIKHTENSRNCTQFILWDLGYRTIMQYNTTLQNILFDAHPQNIPIGECMESRAEIEALLNASSRFNEKQWVFSTDF